MLKEAVEHYFGVEITPDRLAESVCIYNETRRLLKKLYDLRVSEAPPVTGAEVLSILSAGVAMPKTAFNQLLGDFLREVMKRPKTSKARVRLLVAGSMMDDPEFIENVEDLGAIVVADALCLGARGFWDLIDEKGDVFENLIDRYYMHVPCPRMAGKYPERLGFIKAQIKRARVKGVILQHIRSCDLHGTDNALLKKDLEKEGIATIELERQYGPLADAGRIRTRVQAFLERIGG